MPKGGKSWTAEEEATLRQLLAQGAPRAVIAKTLQRTVAAIEGRLNVIRNRNELSSSSETKD
jgi:hypothetical protein